MFQCIGVVTWIETLFSELLALAILKLVERVTKYENRISEWFNVSFQSLFFFLCVTRHTLMKSCIRSIWAFFLSFLREKLSGQKITQLFSIYYLVYYWIFCICIQKSANWMEESCFWKCVIATARRESENNGKYNERHNQTCTRLSHKQNSSTTDSCYFSRSLSNIFFLLYAKNSNVFMAQHHLWAYCVGRSRNKGMFFFSFWFEALIDQHSQAWSSRLLLCFARALRSQRRRQYLRLRKKIGVRLRSMMIKYEICLEVKVIEIKNLLFLFVVCCGWNQKHRNERRGASKEIETLRAQSVIFFFEKKVVISFYNPNPQLCCLHQIERANRSLDYSWKKHYASFIENPRNRI